MQTETIAAADLTNGAIVIRANGTKFVVVSDPIVNDEGLVSVWVEWLDGYAGLPALGFQPNAALTVAVNVATVSAPVAAPDADIAANYATHAFTYDDDGGRCYNCDARPSGTVATWPCGVREVPRVTRTMTVGENA